MKNKLFHIKEQFPDQNHAIDLLMEKDPEFLSLCEDHDDCVNAIHYWVNSEELEAETRVAEYHTLVRELQEEITRALAALQPPRRD